MPEHPALPLSEDHWRSRWLVEVRWDVLHRISRIEWDPGEDMISGDGVTVCGRRGRFWMPGLLSRMELTRCEACCAALGIPTGQGAPFNALDGDDANV